MTKSTLWGKEFISVSRSTTQFIIEGSQGRNWSRGHRETLLTGLFIVICSAFLSHSTQKHHPRGDTTHSALGPPPSTLNQEKWPQACPHTSLVGALSSLFKMTLVCVKLTKNYTAHIFELIHCRKHYTTWDLKTTWEITSLNINSHQTGGTGNHDYVNFRGLPVTHIVMPVTLSPCCRGIAMGRWGLSTPNFSSLLCPAPPAQTVVPEMKTWHRSFCLEGWTQTGKAGSSLPDLYWIWKQQQQLKAISG